jgi:hypothetical protein
MRQMLNPRVPLVGACDIHIHTAPDLFPRYLDDVTAATMARDAGMAAVMFKAHHESTVSRAIHTEQQVPGIRVFGGITLNRYVGGFNPLAAEAALKAGGKEVWMGTVDTEHHRQVFGSVGTYGLASMDANEEQRKITKGLTVLDETGRLTPDAVAIVDLVTEHDAILGTSHLSPAEIRALLRYAKPKGTKVLLTHPFFTLPNLDLGTLREFIESGAIAEVVAVTFFNLPTEHHPDLRRFKQAVDELGPENFILSSDGGQPFNPNPVEAIRVVAEAMYELGTSLTDLQLILAENPRRLLGI